MRLIDADKLIENFQWCREQAGRYNADQWNDVIQRVNDQPTVEAVTLDRLCEWLSKNSIDIPCACCQNFSNDYCTAIGDASKPCPKTADSWRQAITKWMEGQDAKEET